jgi:hypothetical protein
MAAAVVDERAEPEAVRQAEMKLVDPVTRRLATSHYVGNCMSGGSTCQQEALKLYRTALRSLLALKIVWRDERRDRALSVSQARKNAFLIAFGRLQDRHGAAREGCRGTRDTWGHHQRAIHHHLGAKPPYAAKR